MDELQLIFQRVAIVRPLMAHEDMAHENLSGRYALLIQSSAIIQSSSTGSLQISSLPETLQLHGLILETTGRDARIHVASSRGIVLPIWCQPSVSGN